MERKPEDISFYSPGERLFLLYDFLLEHQPGMRFRYEVWLLKQKKGKPLKT